MAVKVPLYRLIGRSAKAERFLDVYLSRRAYRKEFGREPNLENPVLFSEKLTARKLFERRPIFSTIADKLQARDFVAGRIGNQFLPEIHLVCSRFEEVDFAGLPDKFVVKTNHGSGWILIVEDKKALDRIAARKCLRHWMRTNYYTNSREYFYKNIVRKILIEEFLQEESGGPVLDYKFFVYDGIPKFFSVTRRRFVGDERTAIFFDRNCRQLPLPTECPDDAQPRPATSKQEHLEQNPLERFTIPSNMEELFDIAAKLGRGFDFMRVDLYNPGERILFGELTSLPGGGVRPFIPSLPIYERTFGQEWSLVSCDDRP